MSSVPTLVGNWFGGPLVGLASVVVVAVAIVLEGQAKQDAGVGRVGGRRPARAGAIDFVAVAAQGRDRGRTLVEVVGGLLDGAGKAVQHLEGASGVAVVAHRIGLGERDVVLVVAGLFGRFVGLQGVGVLVEGEVGACPDRSGLGRRRQALVRVCTRVGCSGRSGTG